MTNNHVTVKGREAKVFSHSRGFFIADAAFMSDWELRHDGEWHNGFDGETFWPTHAAAQAFLKSHADPQPATVGREARERFRKWLDDWAYLDPEHTDEVVAMAAEIFAPSPTEDGKGANEQAK